MDQDITTTQECASELAPFQLLVLALSVFVLGALTAEAILDLAPQTAALLHLLDTLICAVFLADFVLRYRRSASKADFLRWGWIDLLSSIPALEVLRWGRIVRVVRLLRVLRAFRSAKELLLCLHARSRGRATLSLAAGAAFLTAIFSSIAILTFERVPGANITSAGDGLWWAFYTMANVDYAGHYPVSPEGKAVRILLVIAGMVLFGIFTGYAASYFLSDDERREAEEIGELRREVKLLREELGRAPAGEARLP